jgi:hypothetical protein
MDTRLGEGSGGIRMSHELVIYRCNKELDVLSYKKASDRFTE